MLKPNLDPHAGIVMKSAHNILRIASNAKKVKIDTQPISADMA